MATKKSKRGSFGFIIAFVIIIVFVVLFATNPKKSDFREYVAEKANTEIGLGVLSGIAADLFVDNAIRNNYFICSTFEYSLLGKNYKYIGILGQFYGLNQ